MYWSNMCWQRANRSLTFYSRQILWSFDLRKVAPHCTNKSTFSVFVASDQNGNINYQSQAAFTHEIIHKLMSISPVSKSRSLKGSQQHHFVCNIVCELFYHAANRRQSNIIQGQLIARSNCMQYCKQKLQCPIIKLVTVSFSLIHQIKIQFLTFLCITQNSIAL